MKRFILLPLLFFSACAQPVTQAPKLDPQAVAQERARQEQIAAAERNRSVTTLSDADIKAKVQRVGSQVVPSAKNVCASMTGSAQGCSYPIGVSREGPVNAAADGEKIVVTSAMVSFTGNDEELAMVIAHEYAHNILRHPESAQINTTTGGIAGALVDAFAASQGYDTGGAFGNLGSEYGMYRYSVDFEKEADYVGLYILANAGYDLTKASDFWRKLSAYDPDSIYGGRTHPSNPDRFVAMSRTIEEINAKRASGAPLLPQMREKGRRFGF